MAGQTKTTTDHETIKKWIEDRGGKPATVKGTEQGQEAGILRVDFPGYGDESRLETISWEEFFEKFDEKHLAFMYQDEMKSGQESRFFKFVSHQTADHVEGGKEKESGKETKRKDR